MFIDYSDELQRLGERIEKIGDIFDIEGKRERIKKLESEAAKPGFWDDTRRAQRIMSSLSDLKDDVSSWERMNEEYNDLCLLNELAISEGDIALSEDVGKSLRKLKQKVEDLEIRSWFREKFDSLDAIVNIHPGAGGIESQDWAEILLRTYLRWSERKGFKVEVNEVSPGEEAGIKDATFTVHGKYAYGLLKAEKGIHRLVRISPYDFQRRRHTSFASVDVIPLIDEKIEVSIDPKDLKVETYRATGPGGQYVNVTDSAVRITHLPSGIVAQCQSERSQFQNKETAMKILRARLYERMQEERRKKIEELRGERKEIAWGSQIRSYILHPYSLVKDHRTDLETGNVQEVLDGNLDDFIIAFHRRRRG
ncbi:MAG: peptide chain release factor 2 [Actinomycetota bacterium]|nr:peptide chain release factor 2 [Actinomycetota bacterium]